MPRKKHRAPASPDAPADDPFECFADQVLALPPEKQVNVLLNMMGEMRRQLEDANARLAQFAAPANGGGS